MPRSDHLPQLRHHKASQQGYTRVHGNFVYFGTWPRAEKVPPDEVKSRFDSWLAQFLAGGRRLPADDSGPTPETVSVNEIAVAFLRHAETFWQDSENRMLGILKGTISHLRTLFGTEQAAEFGPRKLKILQKHFVGLEWSRGFVNGQVGSVRRMFKFAAEEELISPTVWHGLLAVENIRKGTPGVREGKKVRPVARSVIEKVIPLLPPALRAVASLQLLTGARGGEILSMRLCDIDRSDPELWRYTPAHHKTEHHDHERVILLNRNCIDVIEPWADGAEETEQLFSPKRSEDRRAAQRGEKRKTPRWASHMKRNEAIRKAKKRRLRTIYTRGGYRQALKRACEKASVPVFHPHQIRPTVGTELRRKYGLDTARAVLGHRTITVTQNYAEIDAELAQKVARDVG